MMKDLLDIDVNKIDSIADIEAIEEKLRDVMEDKKAEDPFWHWEPNDGEINEPRKEILSRWLKEEDIPQRTDSQLDVLLCRSPIKGVSGGNRSSKTDVGTIGGIIKSTGELPLSLRQYEDQFKDYIERAKKTFICGRVTGVDNKQLHRVIIPMWQKYVPRSYLKNGDWDKSYSKEFDILT
ncbi:MAG: hypothetical protein KAJ10_01480, partial [Thermodesulfovibrionia bacterium]|nr:hypothetical protein [Thermodesulfovibrionia bacterium]